MTENKTGAATTVTAESDRYAISVDGAEVGKAEFCDRDGRRVFTHTEVDKSYEGRGLATILIGERCGRPVTPACRSSPSARWWPTTSPSTTSSRISSQIRSAIVSADDD